MLNRVIVGLGSNKDSETNIKRAGELLRNYLIVSRFSEAVYTEPLGDVKDGPFLNQVVVGYVPDGPEEVVRVFKQTETLLGRTPEDKKRGSIPIDIDLIQWNDLVLKPDDLKRDYISSALHALLATI